MTRLFGIERSLLNCRTGVVGLRERGRGQVGHVARWCDNRNYSYARYRSAIAGAIVSARGVAPGCRGRCQNVVVCTRPNVTPARIDYCFIFNRLL